MLPPIDLNLSHNTIKAKIKTYLWPFFVENFNPHMTRFISFCMSMCQMYIVTSAIQLLSMSVAIIVLFSYLCIISFNGIL